MKITRVYRGVKSNRINIDIEEEFAFSVEESTLVKFNLFLGKEIDRELVFSGVQMGSVLISRGVASH